MAALDDLLGRISDPALRASIEREIAPLRGDQQLGLVFERHLPESVRLYDLPVRTGATVQLRDDPASPTWKVRKVKDGIADLSRLEDDALITTTAPVDGLVVVREFGDPIYPGLEKVGEVKRGGDKPSHVVINGENYHALEMLLYTCEGQVDAIYIDPPYNTGAKDWKYNNDYVDGQDRFRHSKWLSFMEKRLLLAKRLLKPDDSVLVVTIDENEGARLMMLLEEVFPGSTIDQVHIVHNPRGIQGDNFSYVHETAIFVMPRGKRLIVPRILSDEEVLKGTSNFRNWGTESARHDAANCFYPVLVRDGSIVGFGDDRTQDAHFHPAHNEKLGDGSIAVWPVDATGVERKWRYARQSVEGILPLLIVREITTGALKGDQEIVIAKRESKQRTIWQSPKYDSNTHGAQLVKRMLNREFPYPKSLYAVQDCLDAVVRNRPEALVLDFFAGSGTAAHAVMRLNHQDGGRRRSIVVTNNELGADEQTKLAKQGFQPGDPEWESLGVFEYITKPRIEAAVTGRTPEGDPVKGDYKFTDEFPMSEGMDENVEFFKLTYEDPDLVELGMAFHRIAPLLWLRAGAQGPQIDQIDPRGWAVPESGRYGVLFDADRLADFAEAVNGSDTVTHAFVVTNSDALFQQAVSALPDGVECVRLYESYLTSFEINTRGAS